MFNKGSESDIKEGDAKDSKDYVRDAAWLRGWSGCLTLIFAIAKVGWMVARWQWERGCMAYKKQK